MDIQKENDKYLVSLVTNCGATQDEINDLNFDDETGFFESNRLADWFINQINFGWRVWQAAKAQAVPEGFVLVKKVHPDAIVHNQGLGLFKECQLIYGWDGKSKDFKDALNKGFYHGVKLGAKAVLETAVIEAQEPAND